MTDSTVTFEIWPSVLEELRSAFPVDTFNTWFRNLTPHWNGEDQLTLSASNEFTAIWLEENYLELLTEKVSQRAGCIVELEILGAPAVVEMASPQTF